MRRTVSAAVSVAGVVRDAAATAPVPMPTGMRVTSSQGERPASALARAKERRRTVPGADGCDASESCPIWADHVSDHCPVVVTIESTR